MRAAQLPATSSECEWEGSSARELIAVAERFAWRARLPLMIVVCGAPASGKSHLAAALAELADVPRLSSDILRKQLVGVRATERAPDEAYSAGWNARTYAELGRVAAREALTNHGAVVDATFRHRADRETFASAFGAAAPLLFIECQAPAAVLACRAADRERDPARLSDAGLDVAVREHHVWDPLDEIPPGAHLVLRTDRPSGQVVNDVLALLDRRLLETAEAA